MPAPDRPSSPSWLRLLVLTAGVAMVGSNSLILSPLLADVARSLASTPVAVSRATAAYGGASALAALLLAPRIDRLGPRRALFGGLGCLTLATLLSAVASNVAMLILAQALAGLSAGVTLPASYALALAIAAPGQGARTLGRVLTGWSVSMVAGVPAAAALASVAGWRASFLAVTLLAGLATIGVRALPRQPAAAGGPGPVASPLAALAFPSVPPLLAICLLYMACFFGTYAFLGDQVRSVQGISAARAGIVVLAYGAGFGLASFGTGLVDRLGPRRVFPVALLAVAATYGLMAPASASFPAILALAFAWGLANHYAINILLMLITAARPQARGAVLGLNSAVTYAGALLGVSLGGLVYQSLGFAALTGLAALLLAAAAGIAVTMRRPRAAPAPAG